MIREFGKSIKDQKEEEKIAKMAQSIQNWLIFTDYLLRLTFYVSVIWYVWTHI